MFALESKQNINRILFLLLLLILSTGVGLAQRGKITGKLTFSNGEPAAYALVYIEELRKYGTSNEHGEYALNGIPYGTHALEVKTIEAEPAKISVEVRQAEVSLPVILKENGDFNLNEVIVWGKSEAQKLKELGFAVGVLDPRKLEVQSLQTTELLDRTAGVKIRQSGGMGSDVQFNINGLSGNSVRIFIDGIPIRNYGSSFSLSSIPATMIERVEVYKGVVPAELGEDALGGAINVILRKENRKHLATSYSYGSFNTHRWDLNGSYRHAKSGFSVNGSVFYNSTDNSYKVWGDDIYLRSVSGEVTYGKFKRFHDNYVSYGVNAELGFTQVKWADRFLIGVMASDMEKDIQHGAVMSTVYGNRTSAQNNPDGQHPV